MRTTNKVRRQATKISKNIKNWTMAEYLIEAGKYIALAEEMKDLDWAYYTDMQVNIAKIEKNKKWVKK